MAANLRGLTEEAAERAISQTIIGRLALSPDCITDVLEAKKALLKRSEMLEFVDSTDTMSSVGGLDNLKRWLSSAEERGTTAPQIRPRSSERRDHPGRARLRQESLRSRRSRRMETAAGKVRHRRRLRQIHWRNRKAHPESLSEWPKGLAPCVLWIDELEKVFAGSGPDSASADAGVSSRLLASFLSWMQERKAAVFVAATCNNVTVLAARTDPQRPLRRTLLCGPAERSGAKTDLRDSAGQAQTQSRRLRPRSSRRSSQRLFGSRD